MKRCRLCEASKPLDSFHTKPGNRDGKRHECIACVSERRRNNWRRDALEINRVRRVAYSRNPARAALNQEKVREWRYQKRYGITVAEYDAAFERQGGCCALCRAPATGRRFCIDHDHVTGKFRGLLCIQCNSALGKLGDTIEGLLRAVAYLRGELHLTTGADSC